LAESNFLKKEGSVLASISENDAVRLAALLFYDYDGGVVRIEGLGLHKQSDSALSEAIYALYLSSKKESDPNKKTTALQLKSQAPPNARGRRKKPSCNKGSFCCVDERQPKNRKIVHPDKIFKEESSCQVPDGVTCCRIVNLPNGDNLDQVLGCPADYPRAVVTSYWKMASPELDREDSKKEEGTTLVTANINNCNSETETKITYQYTVANTDVISDTIDFSEEMVGNYEDKNAALSKMLIQLGIDVSLETTAVEVDYTIGGCGAVAEKTLGTKTTKRKNYTLPGEKSCKVEVPDETGDLTTIADFKTGVKNKIQFGRLNVRSEEVSDIRKAGPNADCPQPLSGCGDTNRNCPEDYHAFKKEGLCSSSPPPPSNPEPTQDANPSGPTNNATEL
jgi:hypothetical protein